MPFYDELMASTAIRHILVRHEQGAGHAAEGYAAASGRVGVAIATSGPGATNLVTAIADAHMDSVPMIAITGQVFSTLDGHRRVPGGRHRRHHDADHEALVPGHRPGRRARRPSPRRTRSRRPAAPAPCWWTSPKTPSRSRRRSSGRRRSTCPATVRSPRRTASRSSRPPSCWSRPKRPVLYVGGGVIRSGATAELLELAEETGAPVVTTLMARGAFPDSHPQHLGMPGMHGTVPAVLGAAGERPDHRARRPLRRPGHRQGRRVRAERQGRARRHRPGRDRQDPPRRRADRGRRERRHRRPARRLRRHRRRRPRPTSPTGGRSSTSSGRLPARLHRARRRAALAAGHHPAHRRAHRPRGDLRRRRRPAPDVGGAVHQVRAPARLAQLRRRRHHGLRGPGRDGRQGRPARPRGLGDRRRRLLPDDQPGARDLHDQRHPDQGRDHQQLVARHGAAVADPVLRRPALVHRPQHRATTRAACPTS